MERVGWWEWRCSMTERIGDMWKKMKMKMAPNPDVVYEIYGHGRIIGSVHPYDLVSRPSSIFRLPAAFTPPKGMRMVGFTVGHTSYDWTEEDPNA
jgi:hypothetical protein